MLSGINGIAYLLVLVLRFDIGTGNEPLVIIGDPYPTLEVCVSQGAASANWLTQDFTTVTYNCVKVGQ